MHLLLLLILGSWCALATALAQDVRRAVPARPSAQVGQAPGASFRPGDTFEVTLGGVPAEEIASFTRQFTIGGDGYVNVPYGGQVRAAGLTQSQLEQAIQRALIERKIYTNPTITINTTQAARLVTVGGQVRNPSRIPWTSDLTLLTAISACGGTGDFASDKINLTRGGQVQVYSRKKLKRAPQEDPRLLPGDQVEQL